MKRILFALALLLPLICFGQAVNPVLQNGNTITFTANVSGSIPAPVQATPAPSFTQQYVITNTGSNLAFISMATTSAVATANCVVPTGTATLSMPVLQTSQVVISGPPNAFFCGITSSSTSVIYVTPGVGQ